MMVDPMRAVAQEHVFHFRDGKQAHTLKDLLEAVRVMSDDEFMHHVDDQNNDFANWVESVLQDAGLAGDLRRVRSKRETLEVLEGDIGMFDKKLEEGALSAPEKPKSSMQMHEKPIEPTSPPQTIRMPDGELHHTISTQATHNFIVKEFIWGAIAGFVLGLVFMGILMAVGAV